MRRDNSIQIRVSTAEKELLAGLAAHQGVSVARLIRLRCGLDTDSTAAERQYEPRAIDERLARLIKQLEAQGRPDPEGEARRRLGLN